MVGGYKFSALNCCFPHSIAFHSLMRVLSKGDATVLSTEPYGTHAPRRA
jgi:hypothetical protein